MYLDANLMFSQKQIITETSPSEKVLLVGEEIGAGLPIFPLVQVAELFEGLTTLEVQIQTAYMPSTNGLGENESSEAMNAEAISEDAWETIATSGVKTQEELNAIRTINFGSLPPKSGAFLRMYYIVEGIPSKGSLSAALVLDRQI